jgi:hypothetical protein
MFFKADRLKTISIAKNYRTKSHLCIVSYVSNYILINYYLDISYKYKTALN